MAIPLLEAIDIKGREITADALLTQRALARYLVEERQAHYHFTVKNNQPSLLQDILFFFQDRQEPDFVDTRLRTTDGSKPVKSGRPPNSTPTLISLTSDRPLSLNENPSKKRPASTPVKSPMVSPAGSPSRPTPKGSCAPTGATGASKIAVTTSLTGTMMKTVAAFVRAMARKTSLVFVASPLALSSLRAPGASPRKCGNSLEMFGWSSII